MLFSQIRQFHCSGPAFDETRYSINGIEMTRSDVLKVHPTERTVAHWAVLVDWDLQRTRQYVVVDPMDPSGLLYLNHAEYLSQMKVCASASLMLIVVARPGTQRPESLSTSPSSSSHDDSFKNSPWGVQIESKWSRASKISWKTFCTLRGRILQLSNKKEGSTMASESYVTIARTVYVWVQQLAHWAEVKNPGTYIQYFIPLVLHLEKLLRNNGQMAAVQYLKLSLFALYSYISGNPLKSTMPLGFGIRLSHGLPVTWDVGLRTLIRQGKIQPIRVLASLLNLYRALEAPHPDFSVETISRPHPKLEGPLWDEFQVFCRDIFPRILEQHRGKPLPTFKYVSGLYHIVLSAGANVTGPAMAGIVRDAQAWSLQKVNHVLEWFRFHGDMEALRMMATSANEAHFNPEESTEIEEPEPKIKKATPGFVIYQKAHAQALNEHMMSGLPYSEFSFPTEKEYLEMNAPAEEPTLPKLGSHPSFSRFFWGTRDRFSTTGFWGFQDGYPLFKRENVHAPILGRLHAINEPAGKVRVVAIADYWTQVAMKPIHEHLFEILRGIKTDATFNQIGSVESYFRENLSPHWSFDLKSATDLIPLELYKKVLPPLFTQRDGSLAQSIEMIERWANILTDRDWLLPDGSGFVRYGTGQPMGALSSWASMAIVHHALVQFSAWKAGRTSWFSSYRVLGDDVDIAKDSAVAEFYQSSCTAFYITIGLLKSLHSKKNVFEFANQRFCPEGNISPLSYKEELEAQSWTGRLEFARRILARFGTSLKDNAAALLRKAATGTQWRILHPGSSGGRLTDMRNLFCFCLVNPFQSWREATIDSILSWVLLILPMHDRKRVQQLLKSTEVQSQSFLKAFTKRLLEYTLAQVVKQLGQVPDAFHVKHTLQNGRKPIDEMIRHWNTHHLHLRIMDDPKYEGRPSAALEQLNRLLTGFYPPIEGSDGFLRTVPRREEYNFNATFSVLYVVQCFNKRNEVIRKTLKELKKVLETELQYVDHNFKMYEGMKVRNELFNPFRKALELYAQYGDTYKPIILDFGKPMSEYLQVEKECSPATGVFSKSSKINPETEILSAPLGVIQASLNEVFGVQIPAIPLIRFAGLMSSNKGKWMKYLENALSIYIEGEPLRAAIDQHLIPVLRQIKWSRSGGRVELPRVG
jgi:hypothetical protein